MRILFVLIQYTAESELLGSINEQNGIPEKKRIVISSVWCVCCQFQNREKEKNCYREPKEAEKNLFIILPFLWRKNVIKNVMSLCVIFPLFNYKENYLITYNIFFFYKKIFSRKEKSRHKKPKSVEKEYHLLLPFHTININCKKSNF